MSEMVERVARAICIAQGTVPDSECEGMLGWEYCKDEARAAIEAMREPTEAMIAAEAVQDRKYGAPIDCYAVDVRALWTAMIAAALN